MNVHQYTLSDSDAAIELQQ